MSADTQPIDWPAVARASRSHSHFVCFEEPDDPIIYRNEYTDSCNRDHPGLGCGLYWLALDTQKTTGETQ